VAGNVAILPARSGSKRIPGKNVRVFAGRPILAWAIQAALDSGCFERVVVSTDSEDIAAVARAHGAEAPFLRPAELSDDRTPTAPVVAHALQELAHQGSRHEYCCCVYATAPFLKPEFLRQGLELLRTTGAGSVFSVTTFAFPIFRALRLEQDGRLAMFWPEHEQTRSQDLPTACHDAGQFYWLDCARFLAEPRMYWPDSRPVVLPRWLVQDIDDEEDWATAEAMFQALARRQTPSGSGS